jgi:hypothetical protein
MNPRNYRIASHVPRRLSDYKHRHCYDHRISLSLGIVRDVKVVKNSYLRPTVLFLVSYLNDGVSMLHICKGMEFDFIEIVDDRVSLTEITANLNSMEEEIRQAGRWYSDGDFYLDFLKTQYYTFAKYIPAILRTHGYRPSILIL